MLPDKSAVVQATVAFCPHIFSVGAADKCQGIPYLLQSDLVIDYLAGMHGKGILCLLLQIALGVFCHLAQFTALKPLQLTKLGLGFK